MTITMYQSDRMFVNPANDRSVYSALAHDSNGILARGNKLAISVSGLQATIDTGQVLIAGGLVEITAPESLTLPANSSGQICLVVDLTKTNDVSGDAGDADYAVSVNQVYLAAIVGALTQDDLNNGGFIYELPLATFTTSATTAVITQNVPKLDDSGWLNLELVQGAKFIGSDPLMSYAQYRILHRVAYIRFAGVNATATVHGNQIFKIPSVIMPGVEFNTAGLSGQASDKQAGVGLTMQDISQGGTCYATWNTATGANASNLSGSFAYPLD